MKVEMYAGYGSLRELRWKGDLDVLPQKDGIVVIDPDVASYRVDRIDFRLDLKPIRVEIYVR